MKRTKRIITFMSLLLTCLFVHAQGYMYIYQSDGKMLKYPVAAVDSITFFQKYAVQPVEVDLGLSVNWASFNVGAEVPEGYGDYFAWGEVEEKEVYSQDTYMKPSLDDSGILEKKNDAASVHYGDEWRMPTNKECDELKKNCIMTKTTLNGVVGYKFQSKIDGYTDKFIFLPAAGHMNDAELKHAGTGGRYWSSYNGYLYIFGHDLSDSEESESEWGWLNYSGVDYWGGSIRPVCTNKKYVPVTGISLEQTLVCTAVGKKVILNGTITPANATNNVIFVPNGYISATDGRFSYEYEAKSLGKQSMTFGTNDGQSATCIIYVYESDDPEVMAKQDEEMLYDSFARNVASRGAAFLYVPLRAQYNLMGDDVYGAGSFYDDNQFMSDLDNYTFDESSEIVRNTYSGFYNAILDANILIAAHANATDAAGKKAVAEARTLRAYMYMMLAIGWGTPPLVESVVIDEGSLYNCDKDPVRKLTHKELLEWCAKECEASLDDLDERASTEDKEGAYKVTKGFAYSVAGKAYLFAGEYSKAKDVLQKVIDSGKYALVDGEKYWENFHIEGDGNEEKIFEPNLEYDPAVGAWGGPNQKSTWMEANLWNWRSDHFINAPHKVYTGGADGWGGLGVPQWFGDEFFANDGHSYRFDATLKRIDDAVFNMMYARDDINDMTLEQKKASREIGISETRSGLYGQSFYLPFKQLIRGEDTQGGVYGNNVRLNNYTIMRYAEVLLMYAEVCLQTNDADGAKTVINKIRTRAGISELASVNMDILKKEKSYELWLEGCRWADIIRWGDTDRIKKSGQSVPSLFDKMFRDPQADDDNVQWLDGDNTQRFYTVDTHDPLIKYGSDGVGFKEGKHELLPYPQNVIDSNPNLTQNPGW